MALTPFLSLQILIMRINPQNDSAIDRMGPHKIHMLKSYTPM